MCPPSGGFDPPWARADPPDPQPVRARPEVAALAVLLVVGLLLWLGVPVAVAAMLLTVGLGVTLAAPVASIAAVVVALPFAYVTVDLAAMQLSLLELAI